jgi:fucose permease
MTFSIASLPRTTWALFFAMACMCVLGLGDNIRGPLFPELLNFFSLSNANGSLSFAASSGAAFFGTTLSVFLLRRIHPDKLLSLSMFLMAAGLFAMGSAANFGLYLAGSVVFGLSMGTTPVAQNLMLTENVNPEVRTKALSGLHALYGFSSLIAPYLAAHSPQWFSASSVSALSSAMPVLKEWRSSFFITGFLCLLIFGVLMLVKAVPGFDYAAPEKDSSEIKNRNRKAMALMSMFFASYVAAEILVSTRLALYMRSYHNMNLEQSSLYVTYFFVFLLIGRMIFAFKKFDIHLRRQMNVSLFLSLIFLIAGMWIHPLFLTLTGLSMAPFYPLAIVYISEITGPQARKYLTFVMAVQSLVVISMHVGVGYITDAFGLFTAFGVGIILLLASLFGLNKHPDVVL